MKRAESSVTNIQKEISSVKEYLENEAFRYEGKLSWELYLDPEVDSSLKIPRMLIRTFVEKAITHDLIQNRDGGRIEISVNKSNLGVLIMVTDNGVNHKESSSLRQHHQENLVCFNETLKLFNEKHPYSIQYNVLGRSAGNMLSSGSRVLITILLQ